MASPRRDNADDAACTHLAVQLTALVYLVRQAVPDRVSWSAAATDLHTLGVRAPCVLSGRDAVPVAYRAACGTEQTGGHNMSTTPSRLLLRAVHERTAVLVRLGHRRPSYVRDWRRHLFLSTAYGDHRTWTAYLPSRQQIPGRREPA